MLDIVIVDDEPLARERLQRMVVALGYEVSGEAQNAEDALELIKHVDPAVVLLDIEMPGETGLQLAEKISLLEHPPAVIFTTAYDQYALKAFETFAAGYLMKPINRTKLAQALEKAQQLSKAQLAAVHASTEAEDRPKTDSAPTINPPQHLTVHSHRGVDLIAIDSIRYFTADSKYITVVGTQGECLMDGTLKQLETDFAPHFIRIHRNTLVSAQHINGLDRANDGAYSVRLSGVDTKPVVSRRYARKIKGFLDTL
ncbi:LytR/AlgR family response regulator transcription factor [Eionea flava]